MPSKIEWTDETWNPITGCTKISEGCKNCYAERMSKRLAGRYGYPKDDPFKPATYHEDKFYKKFPKNRMIFVCSMGDMFHPAVNIRGEKIREIFRHMAGQENIFLLLTKRPERMAECIDYLYGDDFYDAMPHIWVGTSVENNRVAIERIPHLLEIPATVRFISAEPLLEHIEIGKWIHQLDWVICGSESGPGKREMYFSWARSLRDQCKSAGVPFFFKKDSRGNRELDGELWDQYPSPSHPYYSPTKETP